MRTGAIMFYVYPSTRQPRPFPACNWGVWAKPDDHDSEAPSICVSDGYWTREAAQLEADRLNA